MNKAFCVLSVRLLLSFPIVISARTSSAYSFFQPSSADEKSPIQDLCFNRSVQIDLSNSVTTTEYFRGVPRIGDGPALGGGFEFSTEGWSGGANWMRSIDGRGNDSSAFLGRNYQWNFLNIGAGLGGTWVSNHRYRNALETYIEVTSHPLVWGITPSANIFLGLTDGFRSYGEFKVSRPSYIILSTLETDPYLLFALGDYNSHSFDANHLQFGVGTTWHFVKDWSVGLDVGMIVPLEGVREAAHFSSPRAYAGLTLSTTALSFHLGPATACARIDPELELCTTFSTEHLFRGVPRIGAGPASGGSVELSLLGWSSGASWMTAIDGQDSDGAAFVGYEYFYSPFHLATGLSGTWTTDSRFRSAAETYVQATVTPMLWGITPSATYFVGFTDNFRSYGEIRLSRFSTLVAHRLEIAPYTLLGFGNYNSHSYNTSQCELGIASSMHCSRSVDLRIEASAVIPLPGLKDVSRRDTGGFASISVCWKIGAGKSD